MTPRPDRRLEPTESTLGRLLYLCLEDALRELPHLVSADDRLRIVLRLLSAPRRHRSGKLLGRWLRRANHERGMIRILSKLGGRGTGGHQTEGRLLVRHLCLRLPLFDAIPEQILRDGGDNGTCWYHLIFPVALLLAATALPQASEALCL